MAWLAQNGVRIHIPSKWTTNNDSLLCWTHNNSLEGAFRPLLVGFSLWAFLLWVLKKMHVQLIFLGLNVSRHLLR